jgi:hypothetical protein
MSGMNNGSQIGVVLGAFFVFVICGMVGLYLFTYQPTNGYREQDVNMLQPVGIAPLDNQNAQTNNLNSGANLNNKEGEAALILAEAEAERLRAEACAIRNNCYSPTGTTAVTGSTMLYLLLGGIVVGIAGAFKLLSMLSNRRA